MSRTSSPAPTKLPRWAAPGAAAPGDVREQTVPLRPDLPHTLTTGPGEPPADREALLLSALVKVLSAVTAEKEIVAGYVPATAPPGPATARTLHVAVADGPWYGIVAATASARLRQPDDDPAHEDPTAEPREPEIVLDLRQPATRTGAGPAPLATGTALQVTWAPGDQPALRLRHRTATIDAAYAKRLGTYLRTALDHLVAAPEADHHHLELLSEDEREHHLTGLAGEEVPLPAAMFPGLFEERARTHPHAPAVSHGDTAWDYRTLNAAANHIAAALLARGLQAEDVVAVVMDRTLSWAATVLGVLKAGGAYLPVRPDFPARRVATQLDRSACRFVLGQRSANELIDATAQEPGPPRTCLFVEDLLPATPGTGDPGDPGVPIRPGQLAYVYFTSGSTGAPKGAQCEHAGMVNHLYAKIDSVGLRSGDVVSQTASQCFDISLWQLIAPLLAGAAARIVDTDTQLDPEHFLAELRASRVSVAQLVPSYFEILLGVLERAPRDLGLLRSLSITGEALKLDPVRRWFAIQPHVRLVNAYGATEVSDDTMHEVLARAPERDFVTVGRSLRNVRTYVLDEHGRLAPLGTPGEIVFAGMSVGRGYINDPERTRQAFVPDPYVPGERMYRTGDFGRWLPEGTIEFLGRRDQQVKIRGYRIEIGEIENKLRAAPGVRDCAVVVEHATGPDKSLVAFVAATEAAEEEDLRGHLAALLPAYMVPAHFHRLDALPLNENGKVDKKALGSLARTLGHAPGSHTTPATPTERRLATEWAEALGIPVERIGRHDHFFELGATSLTAVRLVVKLDRTVSLKQLIGTPVLAELAALIDSGTTAAASGHHLLQPLGEPVPDPAATLVCFPYAGGNAVNFQALSKHLAGHRVRVLGVELPAHDFTGAAEQPQDVPQIARRVHDEIRRRVTGPLMLWGHCAGSAHALATARLLEARGTELTKVFLAALLLDPEAALRAEQAEVAALSPAEITRRLLADSAYVELDQLKPERADLVGTAYRHDVCTTNAHLLELHRAPEPHRVTAPVHVVLAADDPTTEGGPERHRDWKAVADRIELHELPEGGHYFISTRPAETAALIGATLTVDA